MGKGFCCCIFTFSIQKKSIALELNSFPPPGRSGAGKGLNEIWNASYLYQSEAKEYQI
jgi:hypothetical protein